MMALIESKIPGFTLRPAEAGDVALVLYFIKELAAYEKLSHQVVATEAALRDALFGARPMAETVLGFYHGEPACFALFFHSFSTFLGQPGLYLEDLFVKPEMRGKGFGRTLLAYLAKVARERNCGRLEWQVLDWNDGAKTFYARLGAESMEEWRTNRLSDGALDRLAADF